MEDEPEAWMQASKRRGAVRVLVAGMVLLAASLAWGLHYWSYAVGASPITYTRVIAILVIAIGGCLTIAGAILLARARR